MYDNLMNKYSYGMMNNPDVLTDYYTRRHTAQYRLHFLTLAEEFVSKAFNAEQNNDQLDMLGDAVLNMPNAPTRVTKEEIAANKKKAKNLIHRSLDVMPAEWVIDYGEPSPSNNPRDNYAINGKTLSSYGDGIIHDYVGILYMVDDNEGAEKLGSVVADQLEYIFTYYEKSDISIYANVRNTKDLYSAMSAYFKLTSAANDNDFGNPQGALAKRTRAKLDYLYKTMFPSMFDRLKEKANENGESTNRGSNAGRYANMLFDLQDYTEGMAIHFGWMDGTPQVDPSAGNQPSIDDLMKQQPIGDSVVK